MEAWIGYNGTLKLSLKIHLRGIEKFKITITIKIKKHSTTDKLSVKNDDFKMKLHPRSYHKLEERSNALLLRISWK